MDKIDRKKTRPKRKQKDKIRRVREKSEGRERNASAFPKKCVPRIFFFFFGNFRYLARKSDSFLSFLHKFN